MGKQTNLQGSCFGGEWTIQKLHIIEEYLRSYSAVLKNQRVKKIYVDGFAGSGKTELKNKSEQVLGMQEDLLGEPQMTTSSMVVQGSPLLSLKYDFDKYYFLELNEERISELKEAIRKEYPHKIDKVHFVAGDCNEKLLDVVSKITVYDRCLMFLDPYALELKWSTLEKVSQCGVVDLWYLFPLSMIRLMEKKREINEANKRKISSILGTDEWFEKLFVESEQINFFGESHYNRISYDMVLEYIKNRFATIFSYVSPDAKILKNKDKNAPMFLLCFMMTNQSVAAQQLAAKLVKSIISSTERM